MQSLEPGDIFTYGMADGVCLALAVGAPRWDGVEWLQHVYWSWNGELGEGRLSLSYVEVRNERTFD